MYVTYVIYVIYVIYVRGAAHIRSINYISHINYINLRLIKLIKLIKLLRLIRQQAPRAAGRQKKFWRLKRVFVTLPLVKKYNNVGGRATGCAPMLKINMEVKEYLDNASDAMELAVAYLDDALSHIRAGKASTKLLDGIKVDYYGSLTPINQVANVSTPDARTIAITPWEKSMFKVIEKAIIDSPLGITPENNGEVIRLGIPPLTEDRRKQLVKQSKAEAENAKVSVRNARREAIEGLKKEIKKGLSEDAERDAEAEVQKLHDKFTKRIDEVFAAKEKEILTV